jgi:enterochelin esterase-like enzyme
MKRLTFTVCLLAFAMMAMTQTGKVSDNLSMTSKILKSERKYAIYLPAGYETSERSYPILYLLHGSGDDQTGWVQFGEVLQIADKSVIDGLATEMIIVMPDGNTGRKGYFNDIKGDWNYEDFFFQEFMPYIEKTYRVKAEKQYRAISGLSMGGGGTFMYALHHPELFSAACPLSASVGPLTLEEAATRLKKQYPDVTDAEVSKYYNNLSALVLVNNMPEDQKKAVSWYIDCGDDDFLSEGNCLVHIAMRKKEIAHEFRVREGAHNWTYWRDALPEVLEFVSKGFHRI